MPIFRTYMVVVLISLFSLAHSLRCHEGFNVSLYGIPFYYWAEHQCSKDSGCFVQEITSSSPNTELKGNGLRFGGCVSVSLASHVTCEELYEENSTLTIKNVFDILRGLDSKVEKFVEDMVKDGDTHLGLFFSRGKGPEEFIAGVLEFMEALGYNKSKIEAPLNNLARAVVEYDTVSMINAASQLLTSAQVNNQATKMLSRALLNFVSQILDDERLLVVSVFTNNLPGLLYPILRSYIGPDGLQDGYVAVAKGFINLDIKKPYVVVAKGFINFDIEKPQAIVTENYQAIFLGAVVGMQSFIVIASPNSRYKVYQTTKNIIQVYKEANLDSSLPDQIMKVADLVDKYAKKIESLPSCRAMDLACTSKNALAKIPFRDQVYAEILEIYGRSTETDPNEELVEALKRLILQKLVIQQSNRPGLDHMFAELFDLLEPEVETLFHKLSHEKNKTRKLLSPDTCKHLRCTESLCNSHEAFSSLKNSDKSGVPKGEL